MLPTIATIVATRDRPELLRETLAAIAAQDYEGVISTIVVFDQTEPDLSLTVHGTNRPVTIVANARVQGLQGARNTGMQATSSDLIAFCDDRPGWVRRRLRVAASCGANHGYVARSRSTGDRPLAHCLVLCRALANAYRWASVHPRSIPRV